MAKVPTYTAEANIPAGGTGPQASPAAYAAPARAMGQLGETIAQTGVRTGIGVLNLYAEQERERKRIEKERADQDAAFWSAGQNEAYQKSLIDFVIQNKNKDNIEQLYSDFAQKKSEELMSGAPSGDAAKRFKLAADRTFNTYYGNVLGQSENNRISKFETGLREATVNITDIMNTGGVFAGEGPLKDRLAAIDSFGISDESKRKLRGMLTREVAIGVASQHSWYSRQIVEQSKDIDPSQKETLFNHFDSIDAAGMEAQFNAFERSFADARGSAVTDGIKMRMPSEIDNLRPMFKTPEAFNKYKQAKQDEVDVHNTTVTLTKDLNYLNPKFASSTIEAKFRQLPGRMQTAIRQIKDHMVSAMSDMAEKDPLQYVSQNPKIAAQSKLISDLGVSLNQAITSRDEQRVQILEDQLTKANNQLIKTAWSLQGSYSEFAQTAKEQGLDFASIEGKYTPEEFLNKPQSERRVLTRERAETLFGQLTKGGWKEQYAAFKNLQSSMLDDRMFMVAAKDLEQMNPNGSGLMQTMISALEVEKGGRPDLVQMILEPNDNVRAFLKDKESFDKIEKALKENKLWQSSKMAYRGASEADDDRVIGFKDAILKLAANSMVGGATKNEVDAVKEAVQAVVQSSAWIANVPSVSGSDPMPIPISKGRINPATKQIDPKLGERSQEQADLVAANLSYKIANFDVNQLSLYDSYKRPIFQNVVESAYVFSQETLEPESQKLLQRFVRQNGFWRTDVGHNDATLFFRGLNGIPFAPLNKDGQYIRVNFNDLEQSNMQQQERQYMREQSLQQRMYAPGTRGLQ